MRKIVLLMALCFSAQLIIAQCDSWEGAATKDDAETAHTIYRGALKAYQSSKSADDLNNAFEHWEKAYTLAPSADGKRDYHFVNGAELYVAKLASAADADKPAMKEKIVQLYDEAIACYEAGGIKPSKCDGKPECITKKIGYIHGLKANDMYYYLNSNYSDNLAAYQKCLEFAGDDALYTVFDPMATIGVYQFQKNLIDKAAILKIYSDLEALADANKESKYAEYYDSSWKIAKSKFDPIEDQIFDCEYFKPQLRQQYEADKDNPETVKTILVLLKRRGCAESDPFVQELDAKWKTYASKVNANRKAEYEANNPGILANKAYQAGNYEEAIAKYREAITQETDPSKKASYHTSIASILFRKLSKFNDARKEARTALQLRPNWGKPLNLIGDMYATGARNCGDAWNQRLAIIAALDKYNAAKADPEYAEDAGRKIAKYSSSLPAQDEGFMRGVKAGQTVTVGCWIGESVRVRFQ